MAGCFGVMFCATSHAAPAIAHEMKDAVDGSRVAGAARIAGPQTEAETGLSWPLPPSQPLAVRPSGVVLFCRYFHRCFATKLIRTEPSKAEWWTGANHGPIGDLLRKLFRTCLSRRLVKGWPAISRLANWNASNGYCRSQYERPFHWKIFGRYDRNVGKPADKTRPGAKITFPAEVFMVAGKKSLCNEQQYICPGRQVVNP